MAKRLIEVISSLFENAGFSVQVSGLEHACMARGHPCLRVGCSGFGLQENVQYRILNFECPRTFEIQH